jgi:hypothetical protein
MAARKGTRPPAAGKGRPRGSQNKLGRNVREMIVAALNKAGGEAWLAQQAKDNPRDFLLLIGKLIPHALTADTEDGKPPFVFMVSETDMKL